MDLDRPLTGKVGERPLTRWRREPQDFARPPTANVTERPPTGISRPPTSISRPPTGISMPQSKMERPTSRRGVKNEVSEYNTSTSSFRPPTARNAMSRPPSASMLQNRVSTATSRLNTMSSMGMSRLGTGLPKNLSQGNSVALDRPITQQGIAAARPSTTRGVPRLARQIQDKRYYEGLIQVKIRELSQEIAAIGRELDNQNKERATFLHYDQRAKDLAAELTDLQGQLADYNIVLDKMTSDTEKSAIEQEAQELMEINDQALSEIEQIFERKHRAERQLRDLNRRIETEKKNAEKIVENMDLEMREKYDEMNEQKMNLQREIDEMRIESDRLTTEKTNMEEQIALSQVKQEAVKLHVKIMEMEEKRDKLLEEEKNRLSPEEEKERLLQKVKQDNMDIAAAERQVAEMEKKISEVEQELEQLETDLDDSQSDQQARYNELRKREEAIESFMSTFEENKNEELEKLEHIEALIIDRLEKLSNRIDGDVNTKISIADELAILKAKSNEDFKKMNQDQSFDGLKREYIKLKQTLSKMESLEKKLKTELDDLNENIKKRKQELIDLEDLEGFKKRSEEKRIELLAEKEKLQLLQPERRKELENLRKTYNEIKERLEKNETYVQISALEDKLEKLEQSNKATEDLIKEQKDRINYTPMKENVFSLVTQYNNVLVESVKVAY